MAAKVPILTYHKISPVNSKSIYPGTFVPPALFEKHLRYLSRKGYQTIRLESLFSVSMPSQPIVLTFDDGFQDFEDAAFPLMQKFGMNGTVFLVSDFIGKDNGWDVAIGDVGYPLMSADSIRKLASQGVEFGSHTRRHRRLTEISGQEQEDEIVGSRRLLELDLGLSIDTFCYPYGGYNESSVAWAREAGYKFATSCEKGLNDGSEDPLLLKRIAIRNDTSLPVFIYKLWRAFRFGR
ncbi:MAG: polysaccharide deacetylase family protein [Armatimonadetes bacterium]|nr:polysaccharide deacetylase family protein [Armatimonadota bacterium]